MNFIYRLTPLVLLFVIPLSLDAQVTSGFRVFHEKDPKTNDYFIYASNSTGKDLHVVIDFNSLVGYRSSAGAPIKVNIGSGRTKVSTLKRDELTSDATFNYRFYNISGVANPKVKEVNYAMPIKAGTKSEIRTLSNIKAIFGQPSVELYGIAFKANVGDTIFAARRGVVRELIGGKETKGENLLYSKERNRIEVQHKDGTFAKYEIFESNSAMVAVGDEVKVGQPLALVSGEKYDLGPHFRLMVMLLSFDYDKSLNSKAWYTNKYLVPKFVTNENEPVQLISGSTYQAVLNDELITQEMSKRQRKNYLKTKR